MTSAAVVCHDPSQSYGIERPCFRKQLREPRCPLQGRIQHPMTTERPRSLRVVYCLDRDLDRHSLITLELVRMEQAVLPVRRQAYAHLGFGQFQGRDASEPVSEHQESAAPARALPCPVNRVCNRLTARQHLGDAHGYG